jgi:hypothetical protein
VISFAVDPATKGHFGSNIGFAELSAGMGA